MPPPPLPSFSSILCAPSLSSSSATSVFSVSHPFDSSSNVLFALSVFISDNFSLVVVVVVVVVVLSSSSFSFFSRSYVNSSICSFLLAIFNTIRPSLANRRRRSCASSSSSSSSSTFSLSPPTTANRIASFSPPATTARIASSSSPSRVRSHCESRSRSVSSRSALVNVVVVVGLASNSPPPRVVGVGDGDDCIIDGRTTTPAMFSNDIFVSLSLKSLFTLSLSLSHCVVVVYVVVLFVKRRWSEGETKASSSSSSILSRRPREDSVHETPRSALSSRSRVFSLSFVVVWNYIIKIYKKGRRFLPIIIIVGTTFQKKRECCFRS